MRFVLAWLLLLVALLTSGWASASWSVSGTTTWQTIEEAPQPTAGTAGLRVRPAPEPAVAAHPTDHDATDSEYQVDHGPECPRLDESPAARGGPEHHLLTNKNRISTARGGPWTPRFEDMARRAGMTLDDVANRVRIPGHRGPHPEAYQEAVLDRLRTATRGLEGDAYSAAFRAELSAIRTEAATAGSALNRLLVP